jgi:hypothetical protein
VAAGAEPASVAFTSGLAAGEQDARAAPPETTRAVFKKLRLEDFADIWIGSPS